MALNGTNFETYFNDASSGLYRDGQGAGAITPEDHRELVTEIKESFHNTQYISGSLFEASVGVINLMGTNFHQVVRGDTISTNISISIIGDNFKPSFTFIFKVSGVFSTEITLPTNFFFLSTETRWDSGTKKFVPLENGIYKMTADWFDNGVDPAGWIVDISPSIYL